MQNNVQFSNQNNRFNQNLCSECSPDYKNSHYSSTHNTNRTNEFDDV